MNSYLDACIGYLRKPYVSFLHWHWFPYSWEHNGPTMVESGWAKASYHTNICLSVSYFSFVACRAVQTCMDPSKSIENKFYIGTTTLVNFLNVIYMATIAIHTGRLLTGLRRCYPVWGAHPVRLSLFHFSQFFPKYIKNKRCKTEEEK